MIASGLPHPSRIGAFVLLLWMSIAVTAFAQPAPESMQPVEAPSPDAITGVAAEAHEVPDSDATGGAARETRDTLARPGAHVEDLGELTDSASADPPRLLQSEYFDGGNPRYTMHGKLPYRETNVQPATLATFGGALLALAASVTWYQQAWYPDSMKTAFHFQTDWGYSKQFDKAGHMYGGWLSAYCSYESFIASGFSREDAALWGAIGGLFFQTMMETQDGFFRYGFDPTDQLSNMIGAGYFYAQQKIPSLQYLNPKWMFGPNPRDSAREAAQIRSRIVPDDYDRQDVWLSAKLHYLIPSISGWWPKWLCVALGAGARDVELIGYQPYRVVHIALDYDLVAILPDLGSFGNWLVQGLNAFKLPAPALQIWPHVQFKLLYPFKF